MVKKTEELRPAPARPDEEISGVRVSPLTASPLTASSLTASSLTASPAPPELLVVAPPSGPRLSVANGAWGVWGEELARRLVAEVGVHVLRRFTRLTREDGEAVLAAAAEQLVGEGPPAGAIEARVRHAVFCAAVPVDRRRWIEESEADPAELAHAARRAAALSGRERRVLFAVCALDDVADEGEVGKVVLHAAVAYQMRWNTAHQHLSRAWRRLGEGGFAAACKEWRAGQRFVCPAPSVALWTAARAYLDACNGRGGFGGGAFDLWIDAHEDHNGRFNEWKKQSAAATQGWRAFVGGLDESGVRPVEVVAALVAACRELGADRWVVPAKIGHQTWRDLLHEAPRPSPEARTAWRRFLRAHPFGGAVEAAFRELEREAALAEVASAELERAYKRLLGAAELRSGECVRAKDDFRRLVDAL